jgi:uncharacterized protein
LYLLFCSLEAFERKRGGFKMDLGTLVVLLYLALFAPAVTFLVLSFARGKEKLLWKAIRFGLWGLGGAALLTVGLIVIGPYVRYLWFDAVGYGPRYWKELVTKILLFFGAGIGFGALFWWQLSWPLKILRSVREGSEELSAEPPERGEGEEEELDRYWSFDDPRAIERRKAKKAASFKIALSLIYPIVRCVLAIGVGIALGAVTASSWKEFLQWAQGVNTGEVDPIFGKDLGFYLFSYPFWVLLADTVWWLALAGTMLGTVAVFFAGVQLSTDAKFPKEVQQIFSAARQALKLVCIFPLAALIVKVWVARFGLMFSEAGVVYGASYKDLNFWLPVYWGWIFIFLLAMIVLLLLRYCSKVVAPLFRVKTIKYWAVASAVLLLSVFVVWQIFIVDKKLEATQLDVEREYLEYNIAGTNKAFGLDRAEEIEYDPREDLTLEDLRRSQTTLDAIRLQDWGVLQRWYEEKQVIREYYNVVDVDVDRYRFGDEYCQVMLASRELDVAKLELKEDATADAKLWMKRHLVYTHGYGVVLNRVNEFSADGEPIFRVRDIPPVSDIPGLQVTRPEIYFGENTVQHVYVKTGVDEFSHPTVSGVAYHDYQGRAGIRLGGFLRRLAIAWEYDGLVALYSRYIDSDSRLLLHRAVEERVRELAPFLRFDEDSYKVIRPDGTFVYMVDAYTTSSRYPYSEPLKEGVNYIRNSVKVVVDAYHGSVDFYVFDDACPVLRTWRAIFPGLFKPRSEMPKDLLAHVRYPEDLFAIQNGVYNRYHIKDPYRFYNKEDRWAVSKEKYRDQLQVVAPYFVVVQLPGEEHEEFLLMRPFTPNSRNNMIGWMAGRCDGENYGKLLVYKFPHTRTIEGTLQVEAKIDAREDWSQELTLWKGPGSDVIRANLLVIPIEGGLIQVEPMYLEATSAGNLPKLLKIVVYYAGHLAWGDTMDEALERLFADPAEIPSDSVKLPPVTFDADAAASFKDLDQHLKEYYRLTGEGKPAEAGQHLEAIKTKLDALLSAEVEQRKEETEK